MQATGCSLANYPASFGNKPEHPALAGNFSSHVTDAAVTLGLLLLSTHPWILHLFADLARR
jgi:hypothetical protein